MKAKPSPASAGAALPMPAAKPALRAALRSLARTGPLLALLAAACFAGQASSAAPIHAPALDLPPGCTLSGPLFRFCRFEQPGEPVLQRKVYDYTAKKFVEIPHPRMRQIAIFDSQALTDNGLDPAALRADPRGYLARFGEAWETWNAGIGGAFTRA